MTNDIGRSYLEPSLWPILCRVPACTTTIVVEGRILSAVAAKA